MDPSIETRNPGERAGLECEMILFLKQASGLTHPQLDTGNGRLGFGRSESSERGFGARAL